MMLIGALDEKVILEGNANLFCLIQRSCCTSGVPQGPVLGPHLSLYAASYFIYRILINFHFYADDTQLYVTVKLMKSINVVQLLTCFSVQSFSNTNLRFFNVTPLYLSFVFPHNCLSPD